jgi:hypothetical protein
MLGVPEREIGQFLASSLKEQASGWRRRLDGEMCVGSVGPADLSVTIWSSGSSARVVGARLAYRRNFAMQTHIARYHNIFGPDGTWTGGREKAPAAICRKVAVARTGDEVEVWGDGEQTRSFLYID